MNIANVMLDMLLLSHVIHSKQSTPYIVMNDLQRINYVNVKISIPIILSELCMHILCLPDCLCVGVNALLSTEYV